MDMFISASILRKERRGLQHADDFGRASANLQDLADDRAIAAKVIQPVVVRQHHHRCRAGPVVFRREAHADDGREPHHLEVVARDEADLHLRRGRVFDEVQRERGVLGDLG
jgi:hypothetical protein